MSRIRGSHYDAMKLSRTSKEDQENLRINGWAGETHGFNFRYMNKLILAHNTKTQAITNKIDS